MRTTHPVKTLFFKTVILFSVLFSCELCIRIVHPVSYKRMHPGQFLDIWDTSPLFKKSWMVKDEDLGWVVRRGYSIMSKTGILYKVNNQGFRDVKDFIATSLYNDKTRIMVLGDSFVFGFGAQQQKRLSEVLERKLGERYKVFNLAISGWGIDQMYLAYERYAPFIRPGKVILIFIDDDIFRVIEAYREQMNKPSLILEKNRLKRNTRRQAGALEQLCQKSYLLNIPYRMVLRYFYAKRITEALFLELVDQSRLRREELSIIRLPHEASLHPEGGRGVFKRNFFSFLGFCRKYGIRYFDLYDALAMLPQEEIRQLYLKDGHLSEYGHAYVADFIVKNVLGGDMPDIETPGGLVTPP